MQKISKKIVFFGTDSFSLVTLQGLIDSGYKISAVITKPDSKSGRGQTLKPSIVKQLANNHHIPVWEPLKVADVNDNIAELGDAIGILSSYGKIIPESTINLFKPGIINIHPSLLPIYRGPSPIETAIKNGDEITGVSIMQLSAGMDSGPIYQQTKYKLSGTETSPELYQKLADLGTQNILELLPGIIDGSIQPTPQNDDDAVYCRLISKDESLIKPNEITASEGERMVRAYLEFPRTKIETFGKMIIITKAHTSIEQTTKLDILCKDGNYLSIDQLIAPSGRLMSKKDFLNGNRNN